MSINITNFNPAYLADVNFIDQLISMLTNIKEDIKNIRYEPYRVFINKINKYLNLVIPQLNNDIEQSKKTISIFDDTTKEDDDVDSSGSISEYELDDDALEEEELEINTKYKESCIKLMECMKQYDFGIEKKY